MRSLRCVLIIALLAAGLAAGLATEADAQKRRLPYYASIDASKARMRTGPGREFPETWLYQRSGLPIRVIAVYKEWRKVEDPDGASGWMQANLLSDTRTGYVMGTEAQLLERPQFGARLLWRAAPGVVGRISKCARGWCWLDVRGRGGYVEVNRLWGVDRDEVIG